MIRPAVTSEILDRQPPFNLDAEMGVLGSLLTAYDSPNLVDDVSLVLAPEDFYDDAHARLYRHLLAAHGSGKRCDILVFAERLQAAGEYELIGGSAYIARLVNSVPHSAHAVYYAEIVRAKSMLRGLISSGAELLLEAYETGAVADEVLARAEKSIFSIGDRSAGRDKVVYFREVMLDAMEAIDARRDVGSGGIKTGIRALDRMTGGLKPEQLWIIAARPSMGKTALGHNIAEEVSEEHSTLFVSLEMSASELGERMLSSQSRVDSYYLRTGNISQEARTKIVETSSRIAELKLHILDTPGLTVQQIAAHARRVKRKEGLELLIIDYLNLMEPANTRDPRQEQVAGMSRGLKRLAKELNIPVIALCQLNRQVETTKENKPRLSHLRESGAIEQDADVVLFCYRPAYYSNANTPPGTAEQAALILGKQRNGPTGEIDVLWFPSFTRWDNKADDENFQAGRYTGDGENRTEAFDAYNSRKDFA